MIMPVPDPQAGAKESLKVIATVPQMSDPVAMPVSAGAVDIPHSTVASAGQVIEGGVVSTTVMIWVQVFVFPH